MSAQPKYKEENFYSEQELGSKSKKVNLTDLVERMKEEEEDETVCCRTSHYKYARTHTHIHKHIKHIKPQTAS